MAQTMASTYVGTCRECDREIRHQHPKKIDTRYGESAVLRVRCAECRTTNALEKG